MEKKSAVTLVYLLFEAKLCETIGKQGAGVSSGPHNADQPL